MSNALSFRDQVVADMIRHMEAGTAVIQKSWKPGEYRQAPMNPSTGKPYHGMNAFWLEQRGYSDPRWLTYKQAAAIGAQVRKGEKGSPVEYWKFRETRPLLDEAGRPVLSDTGTPKMVTFELDRPRVFRAVVFNAEQIDGMAPYVAPALDPTFEPVAEAERLLAAGGVPIVHDQNDAAFYVPFRDRIHLPPKAAFTEASEYYATALHELGHATGHASRLNRDLTGPFGSESYAREELRAEMAAYMVNTSLGLGHYPERHAGYLQNWLGALKDDRNILFQAARDAETIQQWITQPDLRPELRQTVEARISPDTTLTPERTPDQTPERTQVAAMAVQGSGGIDQRTYLAVPYAEKDMAKQAGARWDKAASAWYVPPGVALEPFAHWQPTIQPVAPEASPPPGAIKQVNAQEWWEYFAQNIHEGADIDSDVDAEIASLGPYPEPEDLIWIDKDGRRVGWSGSGGADTLDRTDLTEAQTTPPPPAPAPAPTRTYLAVPYAEKDMAKQAGARWDKAASAWYVPPGVALEPFAHWQPKAEATLTAASGPDPQEAFAAAARAHGLKVDTPIMDGAWHQVPLMADTGREVNGAYKAFSDGTPSGQIHNRRTMDEPQQWTMAALNDATLAQSRPPGAVTQVDGWHWYEAAVDAIHMDESRTDFIQMKNDIKALGTPPDREEMIWVDRDGRRIDGPGGPVQSLPPTGLRQAQTLAQTQAQALRPTAEQTPPPARTYLAVPYAEKDMAKQAGARWDKAALAWYVPPGAPVAPLTRWMPKTEATLTTPSGPDPREAFAAAARAHGLRVDTPIMDGKWHRVPLDVDRGKDMNGAYKAFSDGTPSGLIRNYRTMQDPEKWVMTGTTLNREDLDQLRAQSRARHAQQNQDRLRVQQEKARLADHILAQGTPLTGGHPYLDRKQVQAHGLTRHEDGSVMVPCRDANGDLWSVQFIKDDGQKRFLKDGRTDGLMHRIEGDRSGPTVIAEGYATAASLHQASGLTVVVAFNSGNLPKVAEALHRQDPATPLVIAADDDAGTYQKIGRNPGRDAADRAAALTGATVIHPPFTAAERQQGLTDWNDFAVARGTPALTAALRDQGIRPALAADRTPARPLTQARRITPALGAAPGL